MSADEYGKAEVYLNGVRVKKLEDVRHSFAERGGYAHALIGSGRVVMTWLMPWDPKLYIDGKEVKIKDYCKTYNEGAMCGVHCLEGEALGCHFVYSPGSNQDILMIEPSGAEWRVYEEDRCGYELICKYKKEVLVGYKKVLYKEHWPLDKNI